MKKNILVLLAVCFAAALFGQEDLEKKAMDIYRVDMPKDSVTTLKLMKRTGKVYEVFKEFSEKDVPSANDTARGYGLFEINVNDDIYPNFIPSKNMLKGAITCAAAPGEKRIAALGVYLTCPPKTSPLIDTSV